MARRYSFEEEEDLAAFFRIREEDEEIAICGWDGSGNYVRIPRKYKVGDGNHKTGDITAEVAIRCAETVENAHKVEDLGQKRSCGPGVGIPAGRPERPVVRVDRYAFSDRPSLEQVEIPDSVTEIGDHAFYDCRKLRRVQLSDHIRRIGDGAFKNCHDLRYIDLKVIGGRDACIRDILSDCWQEIIVDLHYADGEARLVFPEYEIEYFENYPARLFYHEIYGSGEAYRQCLQETSINWRDYDALFERSGREDRGPVTAAIAMYRLRYPRQLGAERQETYLRWLSDHAQEAVRWCLEEERIQEILWLEEWKVLTISRMSDCMSVAEEFGDPAAAALLMGIEQRMKQAEMSGREKTRRRRYQL